MTWVMNTTNSLPNIDLEQYQTYKLITQRQLLMDKDILPMVMQMVSRTKDLNGQ